MEWDSKQRLALGAEAASRNRVTRDCMSFVECSVQTSGAAAREVLFHLHMHALHCGGLSTSSWPGQ